MLNHWYSAHLCAPCKQERTYKYPYRLRCHIAREMLTYCHALARSCSRLIPCEDRALTIRGFPALHRPTEGCKGFSGVRVKSTDYRWHWIVSLSHAKDAKSAEIYSLSYFTLALEWSQTSLRQECAEANWGRKRKPSTPADGEQTTDDTDLTGLSQI